MNTDEYGKERIERGRGQWLWTHLHLPCAIIRVNQCSSVVGISVD